jgi:hypothetical protein
MARVHSSKNQGGLPHDVETKLVKMLAGLKVPETPLDRMWLDNASAILHYIQKQNTIYGVQMVNLVTRLTANLHGSQRFAWEMLKHLDALANTIKHLERNMRIMDAKPPKPTTPPKIVHIYEESTTIQ